METRSLTVLLEQGQEYFARPVADQFALASASSSFLQVLLRLRVGVRLVALAVHVEN